MDEPRSSLSPGRHFDPAGTSSTPGGDLAKKWTRGADHGMGRSVVPGQRRGLGSRSRRADGRVPRHPERATPRRRGGSRRISLELWRPVARAPEPDPVPDGGGWDQWQRQDPRQGRRQAAPVRRGRVWTLPAGRGRSSHVHRSARAPVAPASRQATFEPGVSICGSPHRPAKRASWKLALRGLRSVPAGSWRYGVCEASQLEAGAAGSAKRGSWKLAATGSRARTAGAACSGRWRVRHGQRRHRFPRCVAPVLPWLPEELSAARRGWSSSTSRRAGRWRRSTRSP